MSKITQLGGFQEAAEVLTALAGKPWSRQGVQQMWKRRGSNGFPERRTYAINGQIKEFFEIQDILDWFAFVEAAQILTQVSGKLWTPSMAWKSWNDREYKDFPDRKLTGGAFIRQAFDKRELEKWWNEHDGERCNNAVHV